MSFAVTSFCRSTNAFARGPDRGNLPAGLDVERRILGALGNVSGRRGKTKCTARLRSRPPPLLQGVAQSERAVARTGAALGLNAGSRHEAGMGGVVHPDGRRTASAGWTRGLKPPEQSTRSQATRRRSAGRSAGATNAALAVRTPPTPATAWPRSTSTPRAASSATSNVGGRCRMSASTGTSIPASTRAATARYVELLLVTATARRPGRTA